MNNNNKINPVQDSLNIDSKDHFYPCRRN